MTDEQATLALAARLESVEKKIDAIRTSDIPGLRVDIATLQVKAGVWGLFGGLIPVIIFLVLQYLKH